MALKIVGRLVVLALGLLPAFTAPAQSPAAPAELAVHDEPRSLSRIEFENGAGETLTLDDFRGRIVVLNLWATWCPPCRREMPTLDRLQAELGGPEFEVVALSVDRAGMEVVDEFFVETGVEHLVPYIDTSMRALPRLAIAGLPTTLVIDQRGREIARRVGEADWATRGMLQYFRGLLGDRVVNAEQGDVQ